jgi:hypothetical protein
MRRSIENILTRYGERVTIEQRQSGEAVTAQAVVQPVLGRTQDAPVTPGELGAVSRQQWIYVGEAETALSVGDHVVWADTRFVVLDTRELRLEGEPLYRWAKLRPGKAAAT